MSEEIVERDGRRTVETRFRVRYYETDAMGIVHHAFYITWFEEGRSAYTRAIGFPYSQLEAEGISLAVAEVTARYHRSAHYDDEVVVATWVEQVQSRGMAFSYEVRRTAGDEILVTGRTTHISVDSSNRVVRLPDAVCRIFGG